MTEYDYSPQAYERYLATQNRIANWVDKTEQHRGEFQSANAGPPDLTRSGPAPASHSKLKKRSSPPSHHRSGPSQPRQLVVHPPPSPSSSSSSSSSPTDDYYEGPWPAQIPQQPPPGMVLPPPMQQHPLSPPPMMMPPQFVTSPHRVSHHHRHRSHDRRRSRSHHHSPTYYSLASPPISPGYQYTYPGGNQAYVMVPPYGGTQMQPMANLSQVSRSAPASVTDFVLPTTQASYPQPPNSAYIASNPQSSSSQQAWSTYGAAPYSMMSTAIGSPPLQPYPGVPTYQSFSVQPPIQSSHLIPPRAHQRIYDLSRADSDKYYKRYVG